MNKLLNKRIDEMKEDIVKSTQRLIQIRSVESEPKKGMPFGEGVNKALLNVLNLAETLGLKNKNVDGYAGYAEIGEGEEILGILCHLDVVPEGKDWTYPPYGGEIHDNKIYGRGAIDNKGPAIGALYALKAIKDMGLELNKRIRVIFGTDEESGWKGMEYYLKNEDKPDYAFSPDAEFPVIYGEKGIIILKFKQVFDLRSNTGNIIIKSIKGGNAPNMVPDYCEALLRVDNYKSVQDKLMNYVDSTGSILDLEIINDNELIIKSQGISAHGSLPQDGKNAISQLICFLDTIELPEDDLTKFIKFYSSKIGMEYNGQSIGCDLRDDISGRLVFNVGMIKIDDNAGEVTVNIRYPVTYSKEDVIKGIIKELEGTEIVFEENSHMEPLFIPKEDPLVKKLMKVYREFTGDNQEPITIGGGTYARAVKKAVAFGPLFPGQPELAHQKDEYIKIDDLILNTKIYANAILELLNE